MMQKNEYLSLVLKNWRAICLQVQTDEEKTLGSYRNHVGLPPSRGGADGIELRPIKNRRQALRAKALIDSFSFKQGSEELRIFTLLKKDQLNEWIKNKKLKAPYQFLLKVPVLQWQRWKTKYYPKPRMIPQLAKDLYPRTSFRLIRLQPRPKVPQRKRGYSDHGSRTPESILARRKAHEAHIAAQKLHIRIKEAQSFAIRARSTPKERQDLFYRIVRDKILRMPKKTTFECIRVIIQKVQQQASTGRYGSKGP